MLKKPQKLAAVPSLPVTKTEPGESQQTFACSATSAEAYTAKYSACAEEIARLCLPLDFDFDADAAEPVLTADCASSGLEASAFKRSLELLDLKLGYVIPVDVLTAAGVMVGDSNQTCKTQQCKGLD